jgi:hypothetical protein
MQDGLRREVQGPQLEFVFNDPADSASNLGASTLAVEGETLVQQVNHNLVYWDLVAMRIVDTFSLEHSSFALLQDTSLVAFRDHDGNGGCAIYRLRNGQLDTFRDISCLQQSLRRGNTKDVIYSVRDDEVVRLRFSGASLVEDGRMSIPARELLAPEQLFALPDGRVVSPGNGISILEIGSTARHHTLAHAPRHLAASSNGRFWYSHSPNVYRAYTRLVLVSADDPERNIQSIDLSPDRIIHMASHGAGIALLLFNFTYEESVWSVAVVDEDGSVRWRATVPRMSMKSFLNYDGCVALSATRLVLHTPNNTLLAWDAKTGASIPIVS